MGSEGLSLRRCGGARRIEDGALARSDLLIEEAVGDPGLFSSRSRLEMEGAQFSGNQPTNLSIFLASAVKSLKTFRSVFWKIIRKCLDDS